MVKHEIDKETLRHDAYRETMFSLVGFVMKHRNWFIAAGVVLVVAVASVAGGVFYLAQQRTQLSAAYYQAEKLLQSTGTEDSARLDAARKGLEKFVSEHPESAHAPAAWMHIAEISWKEKDLDRAEQAFKTVMTHSKAKSTARMLARIGMAKLLENRGDYAGSDGLYRQLTDERHEALKAYHLGRIALKQDNTDEARRQFETASKKLPPTVLGGWARDLLSFLP